MASLKSVTEWDGTVDLLISKNKEALGYQPDIPVSRLALPSSIMTSGTGWAAHRMRGGTLR